MILVLAGRFDDDHGKPSGYAEKLFGNSEGFDLINGGQWSVLQTWAQRAMETKDRTTLIWMPDVPNDKPKLVDQLKQGNPRMLLVTSKNNAEGKYSPLQIVARALQAKSNLLLEFTKADDGRWETTIWDALGNVFLNRSTDPAEIRQRLMERLLFVSSMGRVRSVQVGDAKPVPNETDFFAIAHRYADRFHELVHAANPGRFLGNLSFRCENGFPSFRDGDVIYVSRRNIDKRSIGTDGFVAVDALSTDPIRYYGENKPSVDTPIQIRLFQRYPLVRYMLHSHAYLAGSPTTRQVIPCGAIQEVDAVIETVGADSNLRGWAVNLKGHGSLIATDNLNHMVDLPYISRPVPEYA